MFSIRVEKWFTLLIRGYNGIAKVISQKTLTFDVFNSGCRCTVGLIIDCVIVLLGDCDVVSVEFDLLAHDSE